jgi:hypothetical protein
MHIDRRCPGKIALQSIHQGPGFITQDSHRCSFSNFEAAARGDETDVRPEAPLSSSIWQVDACE